LGCGTVANSGYASYPFGLRANPSRAEVLPLTLGQLRIGGGHAQAGAARVRDLPGGDDLMRDVGYTAARQAA
jgi:nanoRNase/pAp phosphatase (c-di-AMP/oligoRNAs hydrolase)